MSISLDLARQSRASQATQQRPLTSSTCLRLTEGSSFDLVASARARSQIGGGGRASERALHASTGMRHKNAYLGSSIAMQRKDGGQQLLRDGTFGKFNYGLRPPLDRQRGGGGGGSGRMRAEPIFFLPFLGEWGRGGEMRRRIGLAEPKPPQGNLRRRRMLWGGRLTD